MFQTRLHLAQMNNKEISNYLSLRLDFQVTSTSPANNFEEAQWCHVKGGGLGVFGGILPRGEKQNKHATNWANLEDLLHKYARS